LRILRLALDTHLITSHFAPKLLIRRPGGLVVEMTDGTREYNAANYRISAYYDLAKAAPYPARVRPGTGAGTARMHRRRAHPRLAALGDDARELLRHRGQLARQREPSPADVAELALDDVHAARPHERARVRARGAADAAQSGA
jgi:hypothetical protein